MSGINSTLDCCWLILRCHGKNSEKYVELITLFLKNLWILTISDGDHKFLTAFSIIRNVKALCSWQRVTTDVSVDYLSGMKVLSHFGIFLLHSVMMHLSFPSLNPKKVHDLYNSPLVSFVEGLSTIPDTFFVISGLLMTKSILRSLKRFALKH